MDDDDAGSGRDAPDIAVNPLPIQAEWTTGRLTYGVDMIDTYALWLPVAGVVRAQVIAPAYVAVSIKDAEGEERGTLTSEGGASETKILPFVGGETWILRVELLPFDSQEEIVQVQYELNIVIEPHEQVRRIDAVGDPELLFSFAAEGATFSYVSLVAVATPRSTELDGAGHVLTIFELSNMTSSTRNQFCSSGSSGVGLETLWWKGYGMSVDGVEFPSISGGNGFSTLLQVEQEEHEGSTMAWGVSISPRTRMYGWIVWDGEATYEVSDNGTADYRDYDDFKPDHMSLGVGPAYYTSQASTSFELGADGVSMVHVDARQHSGFTVNAAPLIVKPPSAEPVTLANNGRCFGADSSNAGRWSITTEEAAGVRIASGPKTRVAFATFR